MHSANHEILHVDDDPHVTRIVQARLKAYGIATCPLDDPRECLDRIAYDGYRLVLLDIDMPGVDGLDLLAEIKRRDGGVHVIMLTGLVTLSSALRSFRLGAEACLFKPVEDFGLLVDAIHRAFRKIDGWWDTIGELSRRCRNETQTPLPPRDESLALKTTIA